MLFGETNNMVAARSDGDYVSIEAVDPLVGIDMQFGDETAADKAHSHFHHGAHPFMERSSCAPS